MSQATIETPSPRPPSTGPTFEFDFDPEKPAASVAEPIRDPLFYLDPVTFQVGNTLFRVAKSGFIVPGTIFEAMFSLPARGSVEGDSDQNPIHLHGIKAEAFRSFLKVLYPQNPVASYNDLVNALELASMWQFTKLRADIVSSLNPIIEKRSSAEIIFVAKKYSVESWLRQTYKKLANPYTPLAIEDFRGSTRYPVDWETLANIFHIRETIATGVTFGQNITCPSCSQQYGVSYSGTQRYSCDCRVAKLIDTRFQKEFEYMEGLTESVDPPLPGTAPKEASKKQKKGKARV